MCKIPEAAPGWAPEWVFCPEDKILGVVVEWIISGFIVAGNYLVTLVSTPYDVLIDALTVAGASIGYAGGSVADALLGVFIALNTSILDIAASSGLAAPVVTIGLYAGVVFVLILALRGLLAGYKAVRIWLV